LNDLVKSEPPQRSQLASIVPLLALCYSDSKSHNHVLGCELSAASSDAEKDRRVTVLFRLYALMLYTFGLACAQLYHIPDDAGDAPRAMLFLRRFGKCGTVVDAARPGVVLSGVNHALTPTSADLVRGGALGLVWCMGYRAFRRMEHHGGGGTRLHKRFAELNGPHARLDLVATHPAWRRRGLQAALLHRVCADADASDELLYLSSSDPANRAYYERFGFEEVGRAATTPSLITAGMARMPRTRSAALQTVGTIPSKPLAWPLDEAALPPWRVPMVVAEGKTVHVDLLVLACVALLLGCAMLAPEPLRRYWQITVTVCVACSSFLCCRTRGPSTWCMRPRTIAVAARRGRW
jgi:ribosomal protein S18 acetylase RimI-like enzyme